ncbi:coiled-coil domain-containing protein 115 [Betta splendens]|uniref:Vacuolar ATPase assembly protein VMA22 n=1 Tax=Betta splendens TaxID=158456 RepID=A0A6P7N649_BETSP|nr:coiled-coil domain-containing protein 115 [Betta splendens]
MSVTEIEESFQLLDKKLLQFMDQLELLEEKRATLNSLIEQGWFSISKARYSMGNKQVSALQYASEIEPQVHVHTRKLSSDESVFCTERLSQNKESDVASVEDIGSEEGIRRRNKPKDFGEKEAQQKTSGEKASKVTPGKRSEQNPDQDPLRWFGILVPQSLKQAQMSFKQVIDLAAEIATLQTAVLNTRQQLKDDMKNKPILQKEASATQPDGVSD